MQLHIDLIYIYIQPSTNCEQVTFRRMACLYSAAMHTVTYIRGGRIARSLFGSESTPTCDISIYTDGDDKEVGASDVWYARVRMEFLLLYAVEGMQTFKRLASVQVLLLLSVSHAEKKADLVYVRWFDTSGDGWNQSLNLRPLVWHR